MTIGQFVYLFFLNCEKLCELIISRFIFARLFIIDSRPTRTQSDGTGAGITESRSGTCHCYI